MTLLAIGRPQDAIGTTLNVCSPPSPISRKVHLLRAKLSADLRPPLRPALEAIEKLLAIAPGLAEAWLGRSNILFEAKRYEDALTAADKAVAAKPNLAEAWHGRGNALNELKRHEEALAAYDKALAISPNFAGVGTAAATHLTNLSVMTMRLRHTTKRWHWLRLWPKPGSGAATCSTCLSAAKKH